MEYTGTVTRNITNELKLCPFCVGYNLCLSYNGACWRAAITGVIPVDEIYGYPIFEWVTVIWFKSMILGFGWQSLKWEEVSKPCDRVRVENDRIAQQFDSCSGSTANALNGHTLRGGTETTQHHYGQKSSHQGPLSLSQGWTIFTVWIIHCIHYDKSLAKSNRYIHCHRFENWQMPLHPYCIVPIKYHTSRYRDFVK